MSLDLGRILFTVLCFGSFVIILLITYRKGAKKEYDDIAEEILQDDDDPESLSEQEDTHGNGAK